MITQRQAEDVAGKIVERVFPWKYEAKDGKWEAQAAVATKVVRFSLMREIAAMLMEEFQ